MSHPLDSVINHLEWVVRDDFECRHDAHFCGDRVAPHSRLTCEKGRISRAQDKAVLRSFISAIRVLRRERDSICTCHPLPSPEQDPECPEHCDGREALW